MRFNGQLRVQCEKPRPCRDRLIQNYLKKKLFLHLNHVHNKNEYFHSRAEHGNEEKKI
jgi:hypothetical protein